MRSTLGNPGIILSGTLLALFIACGSGSNSPNNRLAVNSPPTATAPVANPADASLLQYKTYIFSTTATDPDLSDTLASVTWDFGDGSAPVVSTTAPFMVNHAFLTSGAIRVTATATDNHGLSGTAAGTTFNVVEGVNPFTLAAGTAPTASNVPLGGSTTLHFPFTMTYDGSGTVPTANVVITPGYSGAAPLSNAVTTVGTLDGAGTWVATVVYPSSAAIGGTYTASPTLVVSDSLGVQSQTLAFPVITFTTVSAVSTPPSIAITAPAASSTQIFALQNATVGFTVTDVGLYTTNVSVDWGDGTAPTTYTLQGPGLATGMAPPSTPTHQYVAAGTYTVTVSAVDGQQTGNTATPQTRTYVVLANALPTATITTPQASGTLPTLGQVQVVLPAAMSPELTLPALVKYPTAVVIPLNGQLNFNGTSTPSTSGEPVSVQWTFPGGNPGSSTALNAGSVSFPGVAGQVVAYLVELKAIDTFGRNSSQVGTGLTGVPAMASSGQDTTAFRKWVIVDGVNTKQFTLNLMYRQLTDDNGPATLTPASLSANGAGATMQIFQDGLSNTYSVLSANSATITVPVRGNLPFFMNLPTFNGNDPVSYMLRIPNVTGQDPTLEMATAPGSSSFTFVDGNPALSIVTAQGFAPETSSTAQRRINCYVSGAEAPVAGYNPFYMVLGSLPANGRWFDRLSVPKTDPNAIPTAFETSNSNAGQFAGIPAYQSFAEWPIYLMTVGSDFMPYTQGGPKSSTSPTTTAGTSTTLGFRLAYPSYATSSATQSDTFGAVGMQAFRVPASTQDPYDLTTASPNWNQASCVAPLNPTVLPASVPGFFSHMIYNDTSATPGGVQGFQVPYNTNDVDRKVTTGLAPRNLGNLMQVFSYAEYIWSSVWVRPLVLNNALLYYGDTDPVHMAAYPFFRRSEPAAWPKYVGVPGIVPDNSTFDLTANGGTIFNAQTPVSRTGAPDNKAVGRFYWTAFTPFYNSANGALITRTWLADAAGLPPTAIPAPASGQATSILGLLPPQDTAVDKRGRDANGVLNGSTLGGYRIMWFNPTKDPDGAVVPPDFWVVEISGTNGSGQGKTHFMLPSNYPVPTASGSLLGQSTTDPILTDARVFLPSQTLPGGTPATDDKVAPGYCWFDVPPELRPTSGTATITVFALKSILNNNPAGNFRSLNRTDWIDAIKTATATISVVNSTNTDLAYVHKIPFNFGWDIVVVNGEATLVAP